MCNLQKVAQCHTPRRGDHSYRAIVATQHSVQPPSRFPCSQCPSTYYTAEGTQRYVNNHELFTAIFPGSHGLSIQEGFDLRMEMDSVQQEIDPVSQPIPALGQHRREQHAASLATITQDTTVRSLVRDEYPEVSEVRRTWKCSCSDRTEYGNPALLHYHQARCEFALARQSPSKLVLRGKCYVLTSRAESRGCSTNPGSENLDEQLKQSSTAPSGAYSNRLPHVVVQAVEGADHLREIDRTLPPGLLSPRRWNDPSKSFPLNHTPRK
jgi:hypothetical protein